MDAPDHDLVLGVDLVARQEGRIQRPGLGCQQRRNGLPVDLDAGEAEPGPGSHVRVMVEELVGGRRDVVATRGVDGIAPVPPVQGGVRVERVQTARERERRHHDRHGQHGADQRRAHRHRGAAVASLEREPQPRDRRRREPHPGRRVDEARSPFHGLGPFAEGAGGPAIGENPGECAPGPTSGRRARSRAPSSRRRSPGNGPLGVSVRSAPTVTGPRRGPPPRELRR